MTGLLYILYLLVYALISITAFTQLGSLTSSYSGFFGAIMSHFALIYGMVNAVTLLVLTLSAPIYFRK